MVGAGVTGAGVTGAGVTGAGVVGEGVVIGRVGAPVGGNEVNEATLSQLLVQMHNE